MYQQKRIINEIVIYLLEQKKLFVAMIICILLGKIIALKERKMIKKKKKTSILVLKNIPEGETSSPSPFLIFKSAVHAHSSRILFVFQCIRCQFNCSRRKLQMK